jgi:hypothetical protein
LNLNEDADARADKIEDDDEEKNGTPRSLDDQRLEAAI